MSEDREAKIQVVYMGSVIKPLQDVVLLEAQEFGCQSGSD